MATEPSTTAVMEIAMITVERQLPEEGRSGS